MRFKDYIQEAKTQYLELKDCPNWVVKILKKHGIKSNLRYEPTIKVNVGGNWHDANVRDIYLYKNGKIETFSGIGGPSLGKKGPGEVGFKGTLDSNKMVLIVNSYPKGAVLYVHPNSVLKILPQSDNINMSKEEWLVLAIVKGRKAAFRKKECDNFGVDYETLRTLLINKKLLKPNGAITVDGKNAIENKFKSSDVWNIARDLGIKSV